MYSHINTSRRIFSLSPYIYNHRPHCTKLRRKLQQNTMPSGPNFLYFTTFSWKKIITDAALEGKIPVSSCLHLLLPYHNLQKPTLQQRATQRARDARSYGVWSLCVSFVRRRRRRSTQKRTQNNEFADEIFTPVLFFVSTTCKKQMDIF
jgi:hypothetical protein